MFRRTACATATVAMLALACSNRAELATEARPNPGFGNPDAEAPEAAAPNTELCASNECPERRTTCSNTPFPCSVDLRSDDDNCGACGRHCPRDLSFSGAFHAITQCVDGSCRFVCGAGNSDCNGLPEDGCEAFVARDKDNCGACGIACTDICVDGECGCPGRFTFCSGEDGGGGGGVSASACKDLAVDPMNCGICGRACPPSTEPPPPSSWHAMYSCVGGQCNRLACKVEFDFVELVRHDWADCNSNLGNPSGDGCEVDIANDSANCGQCGAQCTNGQVCRPIASGIGGECVCPCGAPCFQINSDIDNCGACDRHCPGDRRSIEHRFDTVGAPADPAHGRPVCNQGVCDYSCTPNWADCDGDAANGCETDLLDDPLNCGGCGARCNGIDNQPCIEGKCGTKPCDGPVQ